MARPLHLGRNGLCNRSKARSGHDRFDTGIGAGSPWDWRTACRSAALCGADIVVLSAEASDELLRTCARLAPELRLAIAITSNNVVLFDEDGQQVRSVTTPHGATVGVAGTHANLAIAPATMDVGCLTASGGACCNGRMLLCGGEEHDIDGPGLYLANLVVD